MIISDVTHTLVAKVEDRKCPLEMAVNIKLLRFMKLCTPLVSTMSNQEGIEIAMSLSIIITLLKVCSISFLAYYIFGSLLCHCL